MENRQYTAEIIEDHPLRLKIRRNLAASSIPSPSPKFTRQKQHCSKLPIPVAKPGNARPSRLPTPKASSPTPMPKKANSQPSKIPIPIPIPKVAGIQPLRPPNPMAKPVIIQPHPQRRSKMLLAPHPVVLSQSKPTLQPFVRAIRIQAIINKYGLSGAPEDADADVGLPKYRECLFSTVAQRTRIAALSEWYRKKAKAALVRAEVASGKLERAELERAGLVREEELARIRP